MTQKPKLTRDLNDSELHTTLFNEKLLLCDEFLVNFINDDKMLNFFTTLDGK